MRAVYNDVTIARSDDTIVVECNHYFPLESVERRRSPASLKDAVAFQRRPLQTLERRRRSGGELLTVTNFVAGRMLVVATPALAHEVLRAPPGT